MMFFEPFRAIDRLAAGLLATGSASQAMPVDFYRERDRYVLNADLPGVRPDSVDVSVDGQVLTIRAERAAGTRGEAQWLVNERPSLSLVRQFTVTDDIDAENITAQFDNGVLTVVVPLGPQARPRKIQIGGAQQSQGTLDAGQAQPEAQPQAVLAEANAQNGPAQS